MPERRLRVVVRRRRLYVDADDYAAMLRDRAAAYCRRAEELTATAATPALPGERSLVPPLEEALACRMVAEELEQRADALDAL